MTVLKEEKNTSISCCQASSRSSEESISEPEPVVLKKLVDLQNSSTDSLPSCEPVDIEFQNIKYTVRRFSFSEQKFITKEILHGISGAFRSGDLTAIMGPSGAGKSTLLNVMTGYIATGVTGMVQVNGKVVETGSEKYRCLSCYIHQQDMLRASLTVGEIMLITTHLKLGNKIDLDYKRNLIEKILVMLGLENRQNTFTLRLSGGQKKRLAIALELINNPPVLYLDEPTTGLDSSSCIQCVSLLKRLAQQGHTIVCTIHQPSALIFEMFNKLYTVAEGCCIYQGPVKELVPFLSDLGLQCPSYHNPADYLMEVAVGEHERDISKMINAATKKFYEDSDLHQLKEVNKIINRIQDSIGTSSAGTKSKEEALELLTLKNNSSFFKDVINAKKERNLELNYKIHGASLISQYLLLLKRNFICARRNYFLLMARIISHVAIAIVFGYIYLNVGPKATTVLGNYVYLYGTILLIVYTGKMAVVMQFPLELEMLKREHFNRWYTLGPYFLSIISFEIPFQIFCVSLYITISFYLTGNFSEDFRFYYFTLMAVLATLSAQAWGFFIGATLPIKLAVFIGPILAVLFSVFGFCTRYIDITPMFRWMWFLSYFRAGFHGVLNAVYGMDKEFLQCPDKEIYCHFKSPKVFLEEMMISDVHIEDGVCLMSSVIIVMHVLTILTLWYKLNKR